MTVEELRRCFLSFPEVTEETPFDESTVVYKTAGKMFALIDWEQKPLSMNLKCEPSRAEELRDAHACVVPGYHMSKKHWNTVILEGALVDDATLREWITHSFERVVAGMPKKDQIRLLDKHKQGPADSDGPQDKELRNELKRRI